MCQRVVARAIHDVAASVDVVHVRPPRERSTIDRRGLAELRARGAMVRVLQFVMSDAGTRLPHVTNQETSEDLVVMNRLAYAALAALLSTFACVGCAADGTASGDEDVQQSAASSELGGKVVVGLPNGDVRESLDLGAKKIDAVNEQMQADPTLKLEGDRARFDDRAATSNAAKPDLGLVTQEQFPTAIYKK